MSQSYETLLVERRGRVALITINRPAKLNALNIQTRQEGAAALDELRDDGEVRVVVITGAGPKSFVAGADIGEFAGRTAITQRDVMTGRSLFTAVDAFPKPVIAMINGFCLGGGCELAMSCDLRIAPAIYGTARVGVQIVEPADNWLRLFVSWVADEQQAPSPEGEKQ